jgi:OmpR family response regulator RpaB
MHNEKILIVDKENTLRSFLFERLNTLNYNVFLATNGNEALLFFNKYRPNLVIIDIILPQLDGYNVCRKIKEKSKVPIIFLTALGDLSDLLMGFELGADDFICKPFYPKELEARIRAVLKRNNLNKIEKIGAEQRFFKSNNLAVDIYKKQVFKNKQELKLTELEFILLEFLIKNSGNKLSRISILNNVWGYIPERTIDTRIVDVYISRLRSKLEEDSKSPDFIITVRGTGYMFQTC